MVRGFCCFITFIALAWVPSAGATELTLEEDLAPLVKTLSRPVDVYHWTEAEKAKHAGYTRRRIEEGGVLAATDPLTGRRRSEDRVLFRYTLPKGFRFLDVRATDRQALSSKAAE